MADFVNLNSGGVMIKKKFIVWVPKNALVSGYFDNIYMENLL